MFKNDTKFLKLVGDYFLGGLRYIKNLMYPPSYDDFAKQRKVYFQNAILWILIIITTLGILSTFFYSDDTTTSSMKLMWGNLLLYLITLIFQRRNRINQASWIILANLFVSSIGLEIIFPDSFVTAIILTITISLSGFLLNYYGVVVTTIISLMILAIVHLTIVPDVNMNRALVELQMLGCQGTLLALASRTMEKSDKEIAESRSTLLETSQKLQTILDHFPGFVFWKDRNSVYQGCNQALAEANQLNKPGEIMGKTDYDLFFSDTEADSQRAIDRQVIDSGTPKIEEQQFQVDGNTWWYEVNKVPLFGEDGSVTGILGVLVDITERKKAKEALTRRATDLETVAAISATVTATLNPEQLLQEVSDATKERFNLYHVHVYLFEGNMLYLAAGAGEVGRELVAEKHSIPMKAEKSLVARAARERVAVIANDVQSEADFLPNPLLPKTRSEMAVPLIVGENLLGVLDIQSNQTNFFTQEDINIKTTLARQISVALQNARQYMVVKRMEKALSTSETRLSETMHLAKIGAWELDPKTLVFTFGDHFYTILHTTAEQQCGYQMPAEEYFQRFVHPDDLPSVIEGIQMNLNSPEQRHLVQGEHRVLFADGGIGFVQMEINIVRDETGFISRCYGSIQDITERKKIENALRRKQAQLSSAADLARLGYWEYDAERDLFTFDDHFYHIFHTTAAQQGGYQMSSAEYIQRFVHPESAPILGDGIAKALASTQEFYTTSLEHRICYADGGDGYISVRLVIERNAEGRITHTYGVNQDITEIVTNKNNLIEINQKLEAALAHEKTMQLQLIQSERLSLVGQLMASISHELNNPLQAIQNSLFLLKDEKKVSAQGRQQMEIVLSAAERMSMLLERVRASYRPTKPEDFRSIQLNTLIEDVTALIATYMRHREISLDFVPNPALPTITGIPDQLRQVVLNLLINAAEAMPSGGCITVRIQPLPEQDKILFSVADAGPGIAPELLPHIFEPFVTGKETGTGLGLSITYDIVSQHGGIIQVENNPLGGAIFEVILPLEKTS